MCHQQTSTYDPMLPSPQSLLLTMFTTQNPNHPLAFSIVANTDPKATTLQLKETNRAAWSVQLVQDPNLPLIVVRSTTHELSFCPSCQINLITSLSAKKLDIGMYDKTDQSILHAVCASARIRICRSGIETVSLFLIPGDHFAAGDNVFNVVWAQCHARELFSL